MPEKQNESGKHSLIYSDIVNKSQVAFFKLDEQARIVYVNDYFLTMTHIAEKDIVGSPLSDYLEKDYADALLSFLDSREPELVLECKLINNPQRAVWVQMHLSKIRDNADDAGYIGSMFDITKLKETEGKLEELAHYDTVTGLPNRMFLQEMIRSTIRRVQRNQELFAVLFIDVDNFKHINDSYGHSLGDKLLQHISQRIKNTAREADYVARIGGDEFVVVLDEIDTSHMAASIASRLIDAIHEEIVINGVLLRATVSVGICIYPEGGSGEEELLKHADAAMYKAKAAGKNNYQFYTQKLNEENTRRLQIDTHLRSAIENKELSLVYQPQISLITQKIEGMEALLRWNSAELGNVPPDEFIPIAESIGLIQDIGDWVINEAFEQFSYWARQYPELSICLNVNCSTIQLQQKAFLDYVSDEIKKYDFGPNKVILEATETKLMERVEMAKGHLDSINKIGIRFAIDDFGTGYSSLNYLKQLPISILKIDKSFVKDIPGDANDVAIVKAIIELAKALNLDVIAEGVETREQAEMLMELGCRSAQGFWFAVPLTVDELNDFLRESLGH